MRNKINFTSFMPFSILRTASRLRSIQDGGGQVVLQGVARQVAHQVDGARVHQLQAVHVRLRCLDVWYVI